MVDVAHPPLLPVSGAVAASVPAEAPAVLVVAPASPMLPMPPTPPTPPVALLPPRLDPEDPLLPPSVAPP